MRNVRGAMPGSGGPGLATVRSARLGGGAECPTQRDRRDAGERRARLREASFFGIVGAGVKETPRTVLPSGVSVRVDLRDVVPAAVQRLRFVDRAGGGDRGRGVDR